jgi:hypothetical protein
VIFALDGLRKKTEERRFSGKNAIFCVWCGTGPEKSTAGHFALYAGKCAVQDSPSFPFSLAPDFAEVLVFGLRGRAGARRAPGRFRGVRFGDCAVGCDAERLLASAVEAGRPNRCM